jgi:hypothetical protein
MFTRSGVEELIRESSRQNGGSWGDKGERRTSDVESLFYNWRIE